MTNPLEPIHPADDYPPVRPARRLNDAAVGNAVRTLTREATQRMAERTRAAITELGYHDEGASTRAHVLAREMQAHVETLNVLARTADPYTRTERNFSRLGDLVAVLVRDDENARGRLERANSVRELQRAVANQTTTDNVGVLPTAMPEQTGYGTVGAPTTPLLAAIATPLAQFRATVDIPAWDALPTAQQTGAQKTEVASNAAHLDPVTMNAATFALAYNVSLQLLDSTPTFGDELDQAMRIAVDAALEAYVCTILSAAAPDNPATSATLLDTLATVWATIGTAWKGSEPDIIVASPGAAFTVRRALGTANLNGVMPSVIASPNMPAGSVLVFPRGAVAVYVGDPATEAVVEPGVLGQMVAAYRYGTCGVRVPGAVQEITLT